MRTIKMIKGVVAAALAISLASCSEESETEYADFGPQESTTTTASSSSYPAAEAIDETRIYGREDKAPPSEIAGTRDYVQRIIEERQIPMSYLNGLLNGETPVEEESWIGGAYTTFELWEVKNKDMTFVISKEGIVEDINLESLSVTFYQDGVFSSLY